MPSTVETTQTTTQVRPIVLGEFHGAFSRFQTTAYGDLKRAGIASEVSHKVASDFGADIGNAIRNAEDDSLTAKVGKAKKDGEARIRLSGSGITRTKGSMSLIRLVQVTDGLFDETLVSTRKVDTSNLGKSLTAYFNECVEWAKSQTFTEAAE